MRKWSLWEKGSGIGIFNLGKDKLRGDLIVAFRDLESQYVADGDQLYPVSDENENKLILV